MTSELETLKSILKNLLNRIDGIEKSLDPDREKKIIELTEKNDDLEGDKVELEEKLGNVGSYLEDASRAIEDAESEL